MSHGIQDFDVYFLCHEMHFRRYVNIFNWSIHFPDGTCISSLYFFKDSIFRIIWTIFSSCFFIFPYAFVLSTYLSSLLSCHLIVAPYYLLCLLNVFYFVFFLCIFSIFSLLSLLSFGHISNFLHFIFCVFIFIIFPP